MHKIYDLVKFQLKLKRKQIILWTVILTAIMFMYMILFPSLKDLAQLKMETLPKEMLQLMGTDSFEDLGNYNTYFSMVYKIILVAMSIYIATFSSSLICNDEHTSTIEFLYSQPISRAEIYISKVLVALCAVFLLIFTVSVVVIGCGVLVGGDTFDLGNMLQMLGASIMILLTFMSVSIGIAGISSKYGVGSVSTFFVLLTYMLGYLGELLEDKAEYLMWFSPFEVFSSSDVGNQMVIRVCIGLVICAVLLLSGLFAYKRRDFNI